MRRLFAGITGLLLVITVGCGSSGSKSSSSSSTASSAKSSSSAATTTTATTAPPTTTTTEPPSTAPPTTAAPVNGASTPELAAQGLYDRWVANDPAGARSFAEDGAIAPLFAHPFTAPGYTFQPPCDGAAGTFHCFFSYEGGGADFQVHNEAIIGDGSVTGFKVFAIQYTAD